MSRSAAPLTAVVVGLDCPTGLQTARILAEAGVRVDGVADDPAHPCARTRSCERVVGSDTGSPELLGTLAQLARGRTYAHRVLVPCTDRSVLLLSRLREELPADHELVLAEAGILERLLDKAHFVGLAGELGLPIPPSRTLASRDDAERAAAELPFPCAVKPHRKTAAWRRATDAKLFRADGPEDLLRLYDRCAPWAHPLVAQSWIPGPDTCHYTCDAYFGRGGQPLAAFTSRKIRQWPRTGGQGSLSESLPEPRVRELAVGLFGSLDYRGLAYLETKRDPRTGDHLVLEVNVGRPTGRSAAARAAGVPLLETMYRDAAGLELPAVRAQGREVVRWVHIRRDAQAAASAALRGELGPVEWVRSIRGPRVQALFSWRDPLPFWLDLAGAVGKAISLTAGRVRDLVSRPVDPRPVDDTDGPADELVDLPALRRGYLPLHASAFVHAGRGVIVAGGAHTGKTGALLAFGAHGAHFVADDRVLLRRDGRRMVGPKRPLTVRPWHLGQLPELRRRVPAARRAAARIIGDGTRWPHLVREGLQRRLSVEMSPEEAFGPDRCLEGASPGTVLLLVNHPSEEITVQRVDREEAARRLAGLLEVEEPHGQVRAGLERALQQVETYVVRLPHPYSLSELYARTRHAVDPTTPSLQARDPATGARASEGATAARHVTAEGTTT